MSSDKQHKYATHSKTLTSAMKPMKKRKVTAKCENQGCLVSEKRPGGMEAFHCKCQCGKTWYKSLCGRHERSSLSDLQRMLSKQHSEKGTANYNAPTTRIHKNTICTICERNSDHSIVVKPSIIQAKSHCIQQFECVCGNEWFTDHSGIVKRTRIDMLINELNNKKSSTATTTKKDRKVHKCRACKNKPLPEGTLIEIWRVGLLEMKCTECQHCYYSCPKCDSCCNKISSRTIKHIKDFHPELSLNPNHTRDHVEEADLDQDSNYGNSGCDFEADYDDNDDKEDIPSANVDSEQEKTVQEQEKTVQELKQKQEECKAVKQEQEARDFITNESNFRRLCSRKYFSNTFAGRDGRMNLVNDATAQPVQSELDRDYHLYVTQFVNTLTRKQRLDLVNIFNVSLQRLEEDKGAETPLTSFNEMEQKYLSGTKSILQTMPVPSVIAKNEDTGFVMIQSREIINHMLARGFPLKEYEWNNESHWWNEKGEFHSDILRDIREKVDRMTDEVPDDLIVHILYIWSDSFQKNSLVQTKSTDIQLFTAYFVPPDDIRDIKKYTQPLAIGVKRKDHQQLLASVLDEMVSIGKITNRYCARRQKMIHVVIARTAIQNDNPERKSNTQTLSTGTYHKRWKFSTEFTSEIPSCTTCYRNRLAKAVDHAYCDQNCSSCSECGDWWLDFDNEQTWMSKPKYYPKSKCANSPPCPEDRDIIDGATKLKPVELSFDFLRKAFEFALHNHLKGKWTKGGFEAYLRTCCFNLGLINAMKSIVETAKTNVDENIDICPPEIWERHEDLMIELSEFIDTPMHMLFLGVMKHLVGNMKRLFRSASHTKTFEEFLAIINTALEACKSQSIAWCRTLSLSSKAEFGTQGWQSDHFSALARLSLVYFAYLEDIVEQDTEDDEEYGKSVLALKQVLVLWNCLLSELFTDETCDPRRVDQYTRLFLSACCEYGLRTEKGGKKAMFFDGTTNYFSLLNLSHLMRKYGDFRKLWEGEREKYIKFVKKVLYAMPQNDSFLTTAMRTLLQSHCLDQLMEDNMHTPDGTSERLSNIKVYKDANTLCVENWFKGKPLCGVTLKGIKKIFLCIKGVGNGIELFEIDFADNEGEWKYNLWYAPLYMNDRGVAPNYFKGKKPSCSVSNRDDLKTLISDSVIIHPMVTSEANYKAKNGHTVISWNWKVRVEDGTLRKLSPMATSFDDILT